MAGPVRVLPGPWSWEDSPKGIEGECQQGVEISELSLAYSRIYIEKAKNPFAPSPLRKKEGNELYARNFAHIISCKA